MVPSIDSFVGRSLGVMNIQDDFWIYITWKGSMASLATPISFGLS